VTYPANTINADSCIKTPPLLYFHPKTAKITLSLQSTDAIPADSYSNVRLALSTKTIHAGSFYRTPPLLHSSFKPTKIIQSKNLTDAITDDS
jgi:hypothetical protein